MHLTRPLSLGVTHSQINKQTLSRLLKKIARVHKVAHGHRQLNADTHTQTNEVEDARVGTSKYSSIDNQMKDGHLRHYAYSFQCE